MQSPALVGYGRLGAANFLGLWQSLNRAFIRKRGDPIELNYPKGATTVRLQPGVLQAAARLDPFIVSKQYVCTSVPHRAESRGNFCSEGPILRLRRDLSPSLSAAGVSSPGQAQRAEKFLASVRGVQVESLLHLSRWRPGLFRWGR